ncbi:amino acid transporter [Trichodelitschia bisporula]|uniref:Amino acid transporter n=1 Tax=Trichodelitschia bisporula TaxID=703511 RepID=A0A6G1I4W7_9PEZI|nr:amino acid transporter [Trichodelitschia bisporula]
MALETDVDTLALLGKTQVLKRRFGFWSLFAFAICELITWETVLALFSEPLENGGPAGAIYGFLIAWLSTLSVYACIAELASMAPIACGQYYWVAMLAPPGYKKAFSYVIGWLTSLAWIATVAIESMFAGQMLQGLLVLNYASYMPQRWHSTLLAWAVLVVNVAINVFIPGWLPRFEIGIMAVHIAGFVAVLATLLSTADMGSAASVWTTVRNGGGWPTQGLSFCVGFLGNVATFVGADASVHMAEEVSNAAVNIPRAICAAMIVNGLIGFAMMVTTLYSLGDVDSVLDTKTGFPFLQIFLNATGSAGPAIGLGVVVLVVTWACALGITTTSSRMTWAFARDHGTPFSGVLSRVSRRTRVPVVALVTVAGFAGLLAVIYIGSSTAFNDVISLTITGFYGSYLAPCGFLLWRRLKGEIAPHGSLEELEPETTEKTAVEGEEKGVEPVAGAVLDVLAHRRLVWGPWRLPGWFGTLNNVYACTYMVFVIFWSVWPPATPVKPDTMNYSIVVTGGIMILSGVWYWVRARKVYHGPIVEEGVQRVVLEARRRSSVGRA